MCSSSLQPQANPDNSYAHLQIVGFCSPKLPSWLAGSYLKGTHGCGVWCRVHVWVCVTPLYTAYHYTAIASITSLSSTVTLPSAPLLSVTSRAAVEYSAQHVAGCKGMIIIPGMCPHREEEGVCKSGTVRSLQITKLECSKGTGSLTCLSE